jgi:osmotically-inducible protein OsmY
MRRLITLGLGAAAVIAAARYLDRDKLNRAKGALAKATPSMPGSHRLEDADDVTLARKVETEIFRPADAPKGQVSVDVQNGVAYLRGVVADQAWIERLGDGAKKVDGVKDVKNLLHRPGTPAPSA